MTDAVLAYIAAAIIGLWGVAHAVPTRQVIAGFSGATPDNLLVLTQEWLAEAITMWAFAALIAAVTIGAHTAATDWVYRVIAIALIVLAGLTAATGARTSVVWFKICPVLLTVSAILLLLASAM